MNVVKNIILKVFILLFSISGFLAASEDYVSYEEYGAVGDGVHDDLPAICKAHEYANKHQLPVRSKPDATYHLGSKAITAIIATDTNWGTSRFIIDDTNVENHKKSIFEVRSLLGPEKIQIDKLSRDQKQINVHPRQDCYVQVTNNKIKRYIRRGLNKNSGTSQRDCFILRKDGSIEGDIDWDYDNIDRVEAKPIEDKILLLQGGFFTTVANQMKQEKGYNYWSRNIMVTRSNTVIDGLKHYITGETSVGHPYSGFINVSNCADITIRNCFATGHKTYKTIGAAGKPVSMGSYDYNANSVVNFTMINCRMDNINDRSLWGVIGTNFCKNILLEDCVLSRMDTHMGVSGGYTIRRCVLGYMGLNAIGRGLLTVEDSTLNGRSFINLRSDYGSTWHGDVVIRNCIWKPNAGKVHGLYMLGVSNDGMHNFGYDCFMPEKITIDGLYLDDSGQSENYRGMYFLANPDGKTNSNERPFPYILSKKLVVKDFKSASGKPPHISTNAQINDSIEYVEGSE